MRCRVTAREARAAGGGFSLNLHVSAFAGLCIMCMCGLGSLEHLPNTVSGGHVLYLSCPLVRNSCLVQSELSKLSSGKASLCHFVGWNKATIITLPLNCCPTSLISHCASAFQASENKASVMGGFLVQLGVMWASCRLPAAVNHQRCACLAMMLGTRDTLLHLGCGRMRCCMRS